MTDPLDAVQAEIEALPPSIQESSTAALCVYLASALQGSDSPREIAVVSKELRAALADLRAEAGMAVDRGDIVDELSARRPSAAAAG